MSKRRAIYDFFNKNQQVIRAALMGVTALSLAFLALLLILGYLPAGPISLWIAHHIYSVVSLGVFFIGSSIILGVFSVIFSMKCQTSDYYIHDENSHITVAQTPTTGFYPPQSSIRESRELLQEQTVDTDELHELIINEYCRKP